MSKWGRKKSTPPAGFEYIEATLTALEDELRDRMDDPVDGVHKHAICWPMIQINWQRSRYIYDMFYIHKRISREVYQYCVDQKFCDAPLMAKWKKPGYERLCSTYVINTKNYPYGTVSICRVPKQFLSEGTVVQDYHSGCRGCASGGGGYANIFGNKYGQRLAKIQVKREDAAKQREEQEAREREQVEAQEATEAAGQEEEQEAAERSAKKRKTDPEASTPEPSNPIWANGDEETDDEGSDDEAGPKAPAMPDMETRKALSAHQKHGEAANRPKK